MNKIICGNARTELEKLEDESVDLIITSPPYYKQRSYLKDDVMEIGDEGALIDYERRLGAVFSQCVRVCKPTGNIIFNLGDRYDNGSLQLLPYRFAIRSLDYNDVKLINDITWVKTNPTPRQYKRRLISSTEPFFHFAKSKDYYYNIDAFLAEEKKIEKKIPSCKKGKKYIKLIEKSDLSSDEKGRAIIALAEVVVEYSQREISDFRMKIRGIHKKAFGGQSGGRNSQIDKQGYTIIRMYGKKLKRDVIENSVANTKNIDHPAVFPLKVINELVKLLSKESDLILDPFCGSGQVCISAKSLNRNYLGVDLNPDFCDLAEKRLKDTDNGSVKV
jgi:site-specific DNA-methyltransferase (adenine-specific)